MKRHTRSLTNEARLKGRKSQFELVAEAISFAKELVHQHKLPDDQNPTRFILDHLDEAEKVLAAPAPEKIPPQVREDSPLKNSLSADE
ncbi:MAG: hypothetical protein KDK40_04085 [Chlamydiia bacterium]|nr:hypothetical protein [Chlamydiia bacterium]